MSSDRGAARRRLNAKAALELSPAIIAGWVIGVLGRGTLVAAVLHFGKVEIFLAVLGRTSPPFSL